MGFSVANLLPAKSISKSVMKGQHHLSVLKYVISLQAISEPNFSVAYANMCRCLSLFKVPSESKQGETVNFRAVLLTRCQREFEKDKSSEQLFAEKRQEIEKAEVSYFHFQIF